MTAAGPGEAPVPSGGGPFVYVADLTRPVLAADDLHHLARARRVRDGDPIVLGDGAGGWCPARFAGEHPEPTAAVQRAPRPRPPVGVGFALTKASKPELVIQKLTELGVDVAIPFTADRSVVRWDEQRRGAAHERLVRVAREAAMQSRQPWLMAVDAVSTFAEVAARVGACRAERGGGPPSLSRPLVLTGPEGGWSDVEAVIDLPVVGLGHGVLRAETAAMAAGVLLTALRAGLVAGTT